MTIDIAKLRELYAKANAAPFDRLADAAWVDAIEAAAPELFDRIEALEKDAARYRWLLCRLRGGGSITYGQPDSRKTKYTFNAVEPFSSEYPDAATAIDDAMKDKP